MWPLSIAISTHQAAFQAVAFKGNLEATAAHLAALGYDGLELAIRNPALVDTTALQALLRRHNLRLSAIGTGQILEEGLSLSSPDAETRQAARERLSAHIDLAAQFGALVIIGLARGRAPSPTLRSQALVLLAEELAALANLAAARGVCLAVEPINRYETDLLNTVAEALSFVEGLCSSCVGLLLDTFHMNIEEKGLRESIALAAGRLLHFHVADSNRWYPGAGHIDFAAVLHALRAAGYTGFVSGEFLPLPTPEQAAERAAAHLRALFAAL